MHTLKIARERYCSCSSLNDRGAVLVEYVLLLSVFILAVVVGIGSLDDSIEGETQETAAEIGGQPPEAVAGTTPWADDPTGVSSVAPPTTPTSSTSSIPGSLPGGPPIVDAGPDGAIAPGQPLTQIGSASDPDGDPFTIEWTASGGGTVVGANNTETVQVMWTKPGTHRVTISAEDGPGWVATDDAFITVSSGEITPTGIDESYWLGKNDWVPQVEIDLFNQFGERVALGSTVVVQFTKPDGSTSTEYCIVDSNAQVDCSDASVDYTVDWVDAEIIDITGPNVDSWESFQPGGTIRLNPGPRPNDPPVVSAGPDRVVALGSPVIIDGDAIDPEGDALEISWDFTKPGNGADDAIVINGDTTDPQVTFPSAGEYTARIRAIDATNPQQFDWAKILVVEGSVTAGIKDTSSWNDHGEWVPSVEVEYTDGNGEVIPLSATARFEIEYPGGSTSTNGCTLGPSDESCNWSDGVQDSSSVPSVEVTITTVDTPYGIDIELPPTITLVPPGGEPPATTTTTTVAPSTTTSTTTVPPATTTQPPGATTTTTTTAPPATTTTTKKPKGKPPKGF